MSQISNLDPINNEKLHQDLWKRLKIAIDNQISLNESQRIHKVSPVARSSSKPVPILNATPYNPSKERVFGKSLRRIVKLVCAAIFNPVYVAWDAEEFYQEHVKRGRDKKRVKFPIPELGSFSEPLTVVDNKGRIILWYLPELLSIIEQYSIQKATTSIAPLLKKSVKTVKPRRRAPSWRINDGNFVGGNNRRKCQPGSVTFSAGWFAQGHETENDQLLPSLNLRTQLYLGATKWMQLSNDVERLLNLTLSLVNPDLFQSGLAILRKLRRSRNTKEVASQWQSVYTGISIISNRITPPHRDKRGRPEWYDTLVSYCGNRSKPRLFLEDLGLDLNYSSGTVVSFCGLVLKHEVKSWGVGDRVCYAHFMRESVRERLEVDPAGWVNRDDYLPTNMQMDIH